MEDKLLILKLNHSSKSALCRIYEKYRDDLVRIAVGLLNNTNIAEDIVQDVFLMLVHSAGKLEINRNLKGYLTTCVVNRIRDWYRKKSLNTTCLDEAALVISDAETPDQYVECQEEYQALYKAIAKLPYEQKEVVIMRLQGKLKFKDIARLQETSIKTTLSRYNYGLNKLQSILNGEIKNEISKKHRKVYQKCPS